MRRRDAHGLHHKWSIECTWNCEEVPHLINLSRVYSVFCAHNQTIKTKLDGRGPMNSGAVFSGGFPFFDK